MLPCDRLGWIVSQWLRGRRGTKSLRTLTKAKLETLARQQQRQPPEAGDGCNNRHRRLPTASPKRTHNHREREQGSPASAEDRRTVARRGLHEISSALQDSPNWSAHGVGHKGPQQTARLSSLRSSILLQKQLCASELVQLPENSSNARSFFSALLITKVGQRRGKEAPKCPAENYKKGHMFVWGAGQETAIWHGNEKPTVALIFSGVRT